jgi:hypothetical protein
MSRYPLTHSCVEVLEARIAPAAIIDGVFKTGQVGTRIALHAGEGLSTGGDQGGSYMLFVEEGQCIVFTTDLNNNGSLDFNEITGISAGDGLRLVSFADIYGDIVTNLKSDGFLSDSDNNSANDPPQLGGDGRVLLNSRIEKIELRSLTASDIRDVNGDGTVDDLDLATRLVLSSYSIHGNIYAGAGFGTDEIDGGLLIDPTGTILQTSTYTGAVGGDFFIAGIQPMVGSIKVGTAVGDDYFSFGASISNDTQGYMVPFVPQPGVSGGDIQNIRAADPTVTFDVGTLQAGGGGIGAKGGDVFNVHLNGDKGGGFGIVAGSGGSGPNGGGGGSIFEVSGLASITSLVNVRSGDGGQGLTGAGGNGGTITFDDFDVSGNVRIQLGNGGQGFTRGGNGASFPAAQITSPSGADAVTNQIVATWHNRNTPAESIGTHTAIDFDDDGFSDWVFTSSLPGQLVVAFGGSTVTIDLVTQLPIIIPTGDERFTFDENGQVVLDRIYLDGFATAEALTVGDFNNDGHEDIATGSFEVASFSGVRVFLSVFRDLDGDGTAETFSGFTRGIESPLPSLFNVNPDILFDSIVFRSASPVTDLAAGDFDGDGVTDLAVTATYRDVLDTSTGQMIFVMRGDAESPGVGTGSFYPNFGTSEFPSLPVVFFLADNQTETQMEATSLTADSLADIILTGNNDQRVVRALELDLLGNLAFTDIPLGRVDTNRNAEDTAFQNAQVKDLTAVDYDGDGDADIGVLLSNPTGFMVTLRGDTDALGITTFTISSGTAVDQAGIRLGQNGLNLGETYAAIRNTDADGDLLFDDVALLNYSPDNAYFRVNELEIDAANIDMVTAMAAGSFLSIWQAAGRTAAFAFDVHPLVSDGSRPDVQYLVGVDPIANRRPALFEGTAGNLINPDDPTIPGPAFGGTFEYANEFGIHIAAGDGGSSLAGVGGLGGSLGNRLTGSTPNAGNPLIVDPTGDLDIVFPSNVNQGTIFGSTLAAGDGGNGFTRGGNGGAISGVSARDTGTTLDDVISAFAGDGGFAVSGKGGIGGDVFSVSLQRAVEIDAGFGGSGKTGGSGGSVRGNGINAAYDAQTPQLFMTAGAGGSGIKKGGNGGGIVDFVTQFTLTTSGITGPFTMIAGAGGSATSGKGGNGGSILNSSPRSDENAINQQIYVRAGDGGSGVAGGQGGAIRDFTNRPTTPDIPTLLTFIAGNGGGATTGKGGKGGDISNVASPSTAEGTLFPLPHTDLDGYTFDRIFAGNGGGSSGNAGGNGGNISGLDLGASSGAIAVVAGAGGAGLQRGGNGGSVQNSGVASGGPNTGGKVLVIGGAGGDATAFTSNSNDPGADDSVAFGGKVGRGGQGGSITNFTQSNSIDVSVDLIAGNGGSTVNYGTSSDTKAFVGKGGSISNLNISGSIGNIDPAVPISAYNDLDGDGTTDVTVAQFVDIVLRFSPGTSLDDVLGNVGIVTGAAGRIKAIQVQGGGFETQPASNAAKLNGSVKNVTARLLMSAVAGDVNAIAAIHGAQNINVSSGLVGADKDPVGPAPDYESPSGAPTTVPVLGGRLIDGAFVSDNRVPEIDGLPRVFVL